MRLRRHVLECPSNDALWIRALAPGDAIALWRAFGRELGADTPYFFMSLVRAGAHTGVVAELHGAIVGLAIGRVRAKRVARVLALSVDPDENNSEIAAALLEGLLARPAFRGITTLEAASDATPLAANLFSALGQALGRDEPFLATGTHS